MSLITAGLTLLKAKVIESFQGLMSYNANWMYNIFRPFWWKMRSWLCFENFNLIIVIRIPQKTQRTSEMLSSLGWLAWESHDPAFITVHLVTKNFIQNWLQSKKQSQRNVQNKMKYFTNFIIKIMEDRCCGCLMI